MSDATARACRLHQGGIHSLDDLLNRCVLAEHGFEDDCYADPRGECSRWYFDRELRVGARVVFAWRDSVRHPDWFTPAAMAAADAELVAGGGAPLTAAERDPRHVQVTGVHFASLAAAARFDLTALAPGGGAIEHFAAWSTAVAWLQAGARTDHDR